MSAGRPFASNSDPLQGKVTGCAVVAPEKHRQRRKREAPTAALEPGDEGLHVALAAAKDGDERTAGGARGGRGLWLWLPKCGLVCVVWNAKTIRKRCHSGANQSGAVAVSFRLFTCALVTRNGAEGPSKAVRCAASEQEPGRVTCSPNPVL